MRRVAEIVELPLEELVPYAGNAKMHPDWQVEQIRRSIEEFGNCDPVAVWTNAEGELEIVEGHGRVLALRKMGAEKVPAVFLDHLDEDGARAYRLVHNKLTKDSGFDFSLMEDELANIDCDFGAYGFDVPDVEVGEYEETDLSGEIELSSFGEEKFAHECEACGFKFN